MNKVFAVMFGLAVVSGAMVTSVPVVFDQALMDGKDARFAKVFHAKGDVPVLGGAEKLRFMLLLPKLGADLSGGFASGLATPVVHDKLALGEGEHLTELVGFSDCKTWLAFVMTLFHNGLVSHKAFFGGKGALNHGTGFAPVADFVKDKATGAVMKEMFKLLPSHALTHMLAALFAAHL